MWKKKISFSIWTLYYIHQQVYHDMFAEYISIVEDVCGLSFKKRAFVNNKSLNAEYGGFKHAPIVVYPEWAVQIILHGDDENVRNAFRFTLGHELTHKERRCPTLPIRCKLFEFIGQVNELYADFGAAQKVAGGSREALLKSIDYKKENKSKLKTQDTQDRLHPSWQKRRDYAEHFDFDENLIHKIAKDNKCSGKRIETTVINFYKGYDIKLFPPPEPINNTGDTN